MFSAIAQLVTNKRRLITEYALLGCVVAIGGLAFSMWLSRGELRTELKETRDSAAQTTQRLLVVEEGYELNKQALETLKKLRNVDNRSLLDLHEKYRDITSRSEKVEQQLRHLGQSNEDVKKFFNTSLNRALVCVLEPTQCGTDSISPKD